MEQLNAVHIRGYVGTVKLFEIQGKKACRLSVATNLAYYGHDGAAVIETTWHNVTACEGKNIQGLENIAKGDKVELYGRLKNVPYKCADGSERCSMEIVASSLMCLENDQPLSAQF